jgi:hypothetical protein
LYVAGWGTGCCPQVPGYTFIKLRDNKKCIRENTTEGKKWKNICKKTKEHRQVPGSGFTAGPSFAGRT